MSSDLYFVEIGAIEEHVVRLRAAMTGAQGFAGMPYPGGRSFFLFLAFEKDPNGAVGRELLADASAVSRQPLDLLLDAGWLKENIDRYVSEVVLTGARVLDMDAGPEAEQSFGEWLRREQDEPLADPEAVLLAHAPHFECSVHFTRAELAGSFRVGERFGTTAFAAFHEPPWSTPKLWNAPDWNIDEFRVGPDGRPIR